MKFILFFNIVLLIVFKLLIKRNLFFVSVGYLTIFLQILVLLSAPFRTRATSLTLSFSLLCFIFFLISSLIVILPLVVSFCLNEKRKKELVLLEEKTNLFLYNLIYEFKDKVYSLNKYIKPLEENICQKLTKIIWLILSKDVGRLLLITIFYFLPWTIFLFSFYFDLFINQSFYLSVYFMAFWFFIMKINSLIFFCCRNTIWEFFLEILSKEKKLYYHTTSFQNKFFLNKAFLTKLVFDSSTKKMFDLPDTVDFWKTFNKMMYYFLIYSIFYNFWKNILPKIKSFLLNVNLIFVSLGILTYLNIVLGLWFLFLLPFIFIIIYNNDFLKEQEDPLFIFLKSYSSFIRSLQYRLSVEKKFSYSQYDTGLDKVLPYFKNNLWFSLNFFVLLFKTNLGVFLFFFLFCLFNSSAEVFNFYLESFSLFYKILRS